MSGSAPLETTIRSLVREVVREEIRAALAERPAGPGQRNADGQDGYLSLAKAAHHADVAAGTLRRWIRSGRLPAKRAGRVYRIARAELEDFLDREGRAGAETTARARAIVGRRP